MTRLAIVCPGVKLRFEANGRAWPVGQTVAKPLADGPVAVTLITTARTSLAGTPPRPTTATEIRLLPGTAPPPWNWPSIVVRPARVSSRRAGLSGVNPGEGEAAAQTQTWSANKSPSQAAQAVRIETIPAIVAPR